MRSYKFDFKGISKRFSALSVAVAMLGATAYFPMDISAGEVVSADTNISNINTSNTATSNADTTNTNGTITGKLATSNLSSINSLSNNILPEKYSSVEKGFVTSVKNQGSLGICWSYAACAAMESYILSHGYVDSPSKVDLSEYALAYMTYNDSSFVDEIGGTTGDVTTNKSMQYSFQNGGNNSMAFKPLSKWAAIVNEDKAVSADGLYYGELDKESNKYTYKKEDISYILTGQKYISMKDIDRIKNAVMDNGAVATMYAVGLQTFSDKYVYNSEVTGYNHAITIVGWDDNIDKALFANHGVSEPPEDGGWLVKNSWNEYAGDNGYFWMSYYDASLSASEGTIYEVVPAGTYEHNYQHDGSTIFANITKQYTGWYNDATKFANVFKIENEKTQELRTVSFALENENVGYTVNIYKLASSTGKILPENGTLIATTSGKTSYKGYYTVELPETIKLNPKEMFSVVVTFDSVPRIEYSTSSYVTVDDNGDELLRVDNATDLNQSFFWRNSWVDVNIKNDYYPDVNFCIKAFTNDATDTLSGSSIISIGQESMNNVYIQWKKVEGAAAYALYRSEAIDGAYTKIYDGSQCEYKDQKVAVGKKYYYYVKAYNNNTVVENVKASDIKSIAVGPISTVITNVKSTGNGIMLSWDTVEGAKAYELYGSTDGMTFSFIKNISGDLNSYTDTTYGKKYNTKYYYKIKTVTSNGSSNYKSTDSNIVNGQKKLSAPAAFSANMEQYKKGVLSWSKVDNATGYYIVRVIDNNSTEIDVKNVTTYTDNLKNYDENKQVTYYVYPYIIEDGIKKMGEYKALGGIYIRYSSLTNLKYQVDSSGYMVLRWDSFDNSSGTYQDIRYNVYIAESKNGPYTCYTTTQNSYTTKYKENGGRQYYVKVVAEGRSLFYATRRELSAVQNTPLKIGKIQETTGTTQPTQPSTKPSQPSTKPSQPATKPTQAATKPTQSTTKPARPIKATSSEVVINQTQLTVTKVKIGTTTNGLLNQINEKQYCKITKGGRQVSGSIVTATGMSLCVVNNGRVVKTYSIIVAGDTNGDGVINITDMIAIKQNILGRSSLSGIYKTAADINEDGKINITDFIKAKAKILGKE